MSAVRTPPDFEARIKRQFSDAKFTRNQSEALVDAIGNHYTLTWEIAQDVGALRTDVTWLKAAMAALLVHSGIEPRA